VGQRFGEHDLTVQCAAIVPRRHHPFGLGPTVGGCDAATLGRSTRGAFSVDAEHASRRFGQAADGTAFVFARTDLLQPCQQALAWCQGRAARRFGGHEDHRSHPVAVVPARGPGDRIAVRVGSGDDDHRSLRQPRARRRRAGPIGSAVRGAMRGTGHAADMRVRRERRHLQSHYGGRKGLRLI